ncbi:MAG: PcfJ domain-containing protein, partial [Candidatus Binatia bacterium]
ARYHAAAVAAGFVEGALWPLPHPDDAPIPLYALLRAMREWRRLFAPGGRSYGSLDRTLMNLPPQIPARVVCALRHVRLERTITNRLELHMLLLCVGAGMERRGELPACLHVLQHAGELAIRRALLRIGEATERRLDPRQDDDLRVAANYLIDANPTGATLSACVERAIRWHDPRRDFLDLMQRFRLDPPSRHAPETPTARPPHPLPDVPGLVFLATAGDVAAEGQRMQHCIATYADAAVRGRCFLFHAEHEGEVASFEVSAEGDLRQAVGPRNGTNGAVLWGAAELARWLASWTGRPA